MTLPPFDDFRCSQDRAVVMGNSARRIITANKKLSTEETLSQCVRPVGGGCEPGFDVSPNGRFVSYLTDGPGICVKDEAQPPRCVHHVSTLDRLSVADDGRVLFTNNVDRACSYKDTFHSSLEPLPGYQAGSECGAAFLWQPGDEQPQVLELMGRAPQWITPQAAEALRGWAKRHAKSPR